MTNTRTTLIALALLTTLAGCDKQDNPSPQAVDQAREQARVASDAMTSSLKDAGVHAADAAKNLGVVAAHETAVLTEKAQEGAADLNAKAKTAGEDVKQDVKQDAHDVKASTRPSSDTPTTEQKTTGN